MRVSLSLFLTIGIAFISCSNSKKPGHKAIESTSPITDSTVVDIRSLDTSKSTLPYSKMKSKLGQAKLRLRADYDSGHINLDSVSRWFTYNLVYSIIPYWYGTTWDFEGHTNTPNKGEIACGYFVSTTLKHMGTNLNRYKMAQKASLDEIRMLVAEKDICRFGIDSTGIKAIHLRAKLGEGIFLVGLDFHVGYLFINKDGEFFIHSSYLEPVAVTAENALISEALKNTDAIYIGKITNKDFLIKWLHNTYINY